MDQDQGTQRSTGLLYARAAAYQITRSDSFGDRDWMRLESALGRLPREIESTPVTPRSETSPTIPTPPRKLHVWQNGQMLSDQHGWIPSEDDIVRIGFGAPLPSARYGRLGNLDRRPATDGLGAGRRAPETGGQSGG